MALKQNKYCPLANRSGIIVLKAFIGWFIFPSHIIISDYKNFAYVFHLIFIWLCGQSFVI